MKMIYRKILDEICEWRKAIGKAVLQGSGNIETGVPKGEFGY